MTIRVCAALAAVSLLSGCANVPAPGRPEIHYKVPAPAVKHRTALAAPAPVPIPVASPLPDAAAHRARHWPWLH